MYQFEQWPGVDAMKVQWVFPSITSQAFSSPHYTLLTNDLSFHNSNNAWFSFVQQSPSFVVHVIP